MNTAIQQSKTWSNAQAYGFAVVCLVLGLGAGYMVRRAPADLAGVSATPAVASSVLAPATQSAPTPQQLKLMGDKMAEPMLADLERDPKNAKLLASIASVYFRTQQFETATGYYERAIKISPTAERLTALASCYHYAGSSDKAIATLNRALQLDPAWADAWFNLGLLKWEAKDDPKGAIESWQRLLKTNPNHPRRAYVEGMIADAQKHLSVPEKPSKPAM